MVDTDYLRDLWKSPRGTVIRIEILALLAIVLSFFTVIFGSCRRYSKHWIIQKGVLAANALSLSLGTYSIGLMQSSSVKSEMYPVWAASLLTLFGSLDSITTYSLDSNSQLLKFLFQLCLYCGYVLLIGISSLSSDVGNIAIGLLCAVTFMKGSHRSLACVLLGTVRNVNRFIANHMELAPRHGFNPNTMEGCPYVVDWPLDKSTSDVEKEKAIVTMEKLRRCGDPRIGLTSGHTYKDICLSFSLSHLLQRRFFGFSCDESKEMNHRFVFQVLLPQEELIRGGAFESLDMEYLLKLRGKAFEVIEVELAFLFDLFFTNTAFLHYYESKAATFWTFASITSIIFVGVTTALPGTRTTRAPGGTVVVKTTYDFTITIVILASLALVQVLQLIRCWTSNWARVALACQIVRKENPDGLLLRIKAFLCRVSWFEDNYLWRRKLGQYSLVESIRTKESMLCKLLKRPFTSTACVHRLSRMFGSHYIQQVFQGLLGGSTWDREHIKVDREVKLAIIIAFHGYGGILTNGTSSLWRNGQEHLLWACQWEMPSGTSSSSRMENQTHVILTWHIATCYCEMAARLESSARQVNRSNLHVATKLSKYCAYLVVGAPRFLPGHHYDTKHVFDAVVEEATSLLQGARDRYEAMRGLPQSEETIFQRGVKLGKQLEEMQVATRWKVMADFWAEMMLYVAPSDNVKEHFEQLAQGGEFITHLWALLFHAGIVDRHQHLPDPDRDEPYPIERNVVDIAPGELDEP